MSQVFKKMFWGFLFIFLDIHILVVDILPDPLGYYFIYAGVKLLPVNVPSSQNVKNVAILLSIVTIPTIFYQNVMINTSGRVPIIFEWTIYYMLIELINLILIYYTFQMMMDIVNKWGDEALIRRTAKTFTVYVSMTLIVVLFQTFMMNMTTYFLWWFVFFASFIGIILQIDFLFLLRKYRLTDSAEIP